jgi:hypothetical protein
MMTDESVRDLLGEFDGLPTSRDVDLSTRFVDALPVSGASVSVIANGRRQTVLSATDATSMQFDEAQFALEQGPYWDALHGGEDVLAPSILYSTLKLWPRLRPVVENLGIGSVAALPLQLGQLTVGVVTLYGTTPGELSFDQRATARTLARAITFPAIRRAFAIASDDGPSGAGLTASTRAVVDRAVAQVTERLDITSTEAFLYLQAMAVADGVAVQQVAEDVVAHDALALRRITGS